MLMIITIIIIIINNNRGHVLCKFGRGGRIFKKTIAENIKYNFKKASLKRSILIFFLKTLRDWIDPVALGDAFQSLGAQ